MALDAAARLFRGREPATISGECQKDLFLIAFPAGAGQPHARNENYEGGILDCLSELATQFHNARSGRERDGKFDTEIWAFYETPAVFDPTVCCFGCLLRKNKAKVMT